MTGRVLVCRCCGAPLQVVCPTHGADVVADSWPAPAANPPRLRLPRRDHPPQVLREGTALHRTLALVSDDPRAPSTLQQLVEQLGSEVNRVGADLSNLMHRGLVERVGRGRYVRRVAA